MSLPPPPVAARKPHQATVHDVTIDDGGSDEVTADVADDAGSDE